MTGDFSVFLRLGLGHILDWAAVDHLLFVAVLCVSYPWRAWRGLAVLVTAFTLGHSLTLALATLDWIRVDPLVVEVLIPATIAITAILNLFGTWNEPAGTRHYKQRRALHYGMALLFGLIHGMGFSNFLRALLADEPSIVWPLFSFNIGLEMGQLLVVAAVVAVSASLTLLGLAERNWVRLVSASAAAAASYMIIERLTA